MFLALTWRHSAMNNEVSGETAVMRRFQFSLRKLLLVIAAVVVVASHALTSYRLWKAESELRDLRILHGILVVEDVTRVQVQSMNPQQPMTWRWHVYLPQGAMYGVNHYVGDLREFELPASSAPIFGALREGVNTITVKVQRDERGEWARMIYVNMQSLKVSLTEHDAAWLEHSSNRSTGTTTVVANAYDPGDDIELLRIESRDMNSADSATTSEASAAHGLVVWLAKK